MPTRWRSRLRLAPGAVTSMPSTMICPACTCSSPLTQRSIVDLPEPDRPMTATISPFSRLSEIPFSTSTWPKRLCTSRSSTSDTKPPFQHLAQLRDRKADHEIDGGGGKIDRERRESRSADDLAGASQLDEADQRGKRRVLHELNEKADGRRDADADGLRQDHVEEALPVGEPERRAGFPLPLRDRLKAAAPDLAEESRGVDRKRQRCSGPRIDRKADQWQAEEEDEQLSEQRRALDQVDVADGEPVDGPDRHYPEHRDDQAKQPAADHGGQCQSHCPASGCNQIDDVGGAEFADHRCVLRTNASR